MTDPSASVNVSAESRRVFDQFVSRHGTNTYSSEAFEQLCAAFPGLAPDLRKLRDAYGEKQKKLAGDPTRPPSVVESLRRQYGNDIDPNITLDPGAAADTGSAAAPRQSKPPSTAGEELLQKISQHSSPNPRYTYKSEVARGGMGAILKVWDGDLRRNLAMKVILGGEEPEPGAEGAQPDPGGVDPARIARFLEEAQVTGQLDHPGIVPVHELGVGKDGRVYFTMRLVHGRDFQAILDLTKEGKEGWTQTRALNTILRVCEAMAFAHTKNVIHRDLKPANIMVGHFGETYVMDWGLAKVLGHKENAAAAPKLKITDSMDESGVKTLRRDAAVTESGSPLLTMDGEVLGTPCYMSPEQANGKLSEMGPWSDVYAVGAILYHLLAGYMPYVEPGTTATPFMVLDRVKKGPPRPLTEIDQKLPGELIAICEKAMAREPRSRYADMRAMADDLRNYLEGRVVKAYATGAIVEFKKWVLRNKATASAILATILVAIGGLALVALQEKKKQEELKGKNIEISKERDNVKRANEDLASANEEIKKAKKEADANAERASLNEQKAVLALGDYQRLADVKRVQDLYESGREILAKYPPSRSRMQEWIQSARTFAASRLAIHKDSLGKIRNLLVEGRDKFDDNKIVDLRWQADVMGEMVAGLESIQQSTGIVAEMNRCLELWGVATSTDSGWTEAIVSISNTTECPFYEGLKIEPQYGLKPLGRDPVTGFHEFVHLETGVAPERDATGRWVIKDDTGIIFVLLPGGKFDMGAVKPGPLYALNTPNVDPFADTSEGPIHSVVLRPFFISKYELTQPQWVRIAGDNPSKVYPNGKFAATAPPRPVDSVSYDMCAEKLVKIALDLPTEQQWEYAARGGTSFVWWTGNQEKTIEGAGNVKGDRDGFDMIAPVGLTRANGFGIYDTIGNCWEWCRDEYKSYSAAEKAQNDAPEGKVIRNRIMRGGSFNTTASETRSAKRYFLISSVRFDDIGVRPVRAIFE